MHGLNYDASLAYTIATPFSYVHEGVGAWVNAWQTCMHRHAVIVIQYNYELYNVVRFMSAPSTQVRLFKFPNIRKGNAYGPLNLVVHVYCVLHRVCSPTSVVSSSSSCSRFLMKVCVVYKHPPRNVVLKSLQTIKWKLPAFLPAIPCLLPWWDRLSAFRSVLSLFAAFFLGGRWGEKWETQLLNGEYTKQTPQCDTIR